MAINDTAFQRAKNSLAYDIYPKMLLIAEPRIVRCVQELNAEIAVMSALKEFDDLFRSVLDPSISFAQRHSQPALKGSSSREASVSFAKDFDVFAHDSQIMKSLTLVLDKVNAINDLVFDKRQDSLYKYSRIVKKLSDSLSTPISILHVSRLWDSLERARPPSSINRTLNYPKLDFGKFYDDLINVNYYELDFRKGYNAYHGRFQAARIRELDSLIIASVAIFKKDE